MVEKVMSSFRQERAPLLVHLPTEILILIMKYCPNISSLWSLINASSRLKSIFITVAREVIEYVMTETIPVRITNHMRVALLIRTSPNSLLDIGNVVKYMSEEIILGPLQQNISPQVLENFVELAHTLHGVAHACLDFYIEKTKTLKPQCLSDTEVQEIYKNWRLPRHKFDGLLGQPYQPKYYGPPSYLEEQTAIRILWRSQIFIDLKAACSIGALDHWPEEDQNRLQTMAMLDFLQLLCVPGRSRRFSYEQEQLFTVVNFVNETTGEQSEAEDALTRFLHRPPAAVYNRGYHLPCLPKPSPTMERMSGRNVLVDIDSEIGRAQMGWRFHTIMTSDVTKSPLLHFSFKPYRKLGFAFWQDERMFDLGFLGPRSERWGMRQSYSLYFTWRSILTPDEIAEELPELSSLFMAHSSAR
jgi:hypothetical protein